MTPNLQMAEKPAHREDGALEVHSVFYTIQGEGPFAGQPAVFLRLAGCNLQCPGCDTDYTSFRDTHFPEAIVNIVQYAHGGERVAKKNPLVVITGGEPFRQNIWPAVRELISRDYYNIQIETNGTVWSDVDTPCISVTVVCSPKKSFIHDSLKPRLRHLKYIVEADKIDPEDGLPISTMGYEGKVARPWDGFTGTVWLQPFDAQDRVLNKANVDAAVEACKKFGHRMSIQTHKIMGVA